MRSRRLIAATLSLLVGLGAAVANAAPAAATKGSAEGSTEGSAGGPAHPASPGVLTDLGEPILQVLSQDQALGFGPNGEPQAYFIVAGNANIAAEFAVVDIRTHQTVFDTRVPRGDTSWAIDYSAHEKAVYIGMSSDAGAGELYRYRVGSSTLESLGVPLPGERIWGIDVAPDGMVYAGTYPGGRLFSYDPATSAVHDFGQVVPGETYVRGLEATESTVWFGTQPDAKLAALDRATGTITPIPLPDPYPTWTGATAYDIFHRTSPAGADRLFVRVTGTGVSALLVLDLKTGGWVDAIANPATRSVSPVDPADGHTVYFRLSNGHIAAYDIDSLTYVDTGWAPNAIPGDTAWIDMQNPDFPGLSFVFTYYYGRIYVYNPTSRKTDYQQAVVQGAANPLTAIATGPDQKIYLGAYLSPPGMSRLDPATGAFQLLSSAGQVEGYGTWNGKLVYGRYPSGGLLSFDPANPWSMGTNPGPVTSIGSAQDRPKGLAQLGDKVVVASVPSTGELGGALSVWDPATRAIEVHRDVVPAQSPVSVAVRDGLVYAGTSVWGGYGVDPTTTDAQLVIWDPATNQVVYHLVPARGANAVSALTFGPNGHLYLLADGRLVEFDPVKRRVLRSKQLSDAPYALRYGDDQALRFAGDELYATTRGNLLRVDLPSMGSTVLAGDIDAKGLAVDPAGNLYTVGRSTHVYRFTAS